MSLTVKDVKRLLGKKVRVILPQHLGERSEMVLAGYMLRIGYKDSKVYQQLIVRDSSGAEYSVKFENVEEIS